MPKYHRISLKEREQIYSSLKDNLSFSAIGKMMHRSTSTISREVARCRLDPLGYIPDRAQANAVSNFNRNQAILSKNVNLKFLVIKKLHEHWSPEQIAGRLKCENSTAIISHETIYKFVYSEEGQSLKLYNLLTKKKPKRTRWYSRKPKKSHIPESAFICNRPKSIEQRKKLGHWEGDLISFGTVKRSNVTTLVERKSRFSKLRLNKSKFTNSVIDGIRQSLEKIPIRYKKSMTYDRGTEFSHYKKLEITTYFCNPHSPWQKGSNENFNGRLRRYLPKKFDTNFLTQELLDSIEDMLNNQPRKCLGFKTPHEVFYNHFSTAFALDP
jgi:IS30 family transposase